MPIQLKQVRNRISESSYTCICPLHLGSYSPIWPSNSFQLFPERILLSLSTLSDLLRMLYYLAPKTPHHSENELERKLGQTNNSPDYQHMSHMHCLSPKRLSYSFQGECCGITPLRWTQVSHLRDSPFTCTQPHF